MSTKSNSKEKFISYPPEIILSQWQRKFFNILEEFLYQCFECKIDSVPPNETFGNWIKQKIPKISKKAPAAYQWVYKNLIPLYEESRQNGYFGLGGKIGGAKLILGGTSRFLQTQLDSVRKILLYTDTVFIPDPVFPWVEIPRHEESFNHILMAENAYFLLQLKPFVDAELPIPPVIVFPSWEKTLEIQDSQTREGQRALITGVLSDAIGHSFDSYEMLTSYAKGQSAEFLRLIDEKSLFIPPGGQLGAPLDTSIKLYKEFIDEWRSPEYLKKINELPDSLLILNALSERIGPMYHLFENAESIIANPLLSNSAHWHYYRICAHYFEHQLQNLSLLDPRVIAEIQALENPTLNWLGDIPIEALVELKLRGENELFRKEISQQTSILHGASLEDINRVAAEISRAISSLIIKHQNAIKEIQQKYDRKALLNFLLAGVTIAPIILPTIAPLITAFPPLFPLGKIAWNEVSRHLDKKQASRSLFGVLSAAKPSI